jgi:hypothetical protein
MQNFTLNQAAKICHRSKSSILEAIRAGRLSAKMNDKRQWQIEASELHRVYPFVIETPSSTEQKTSENQFIEQGNYQPNVLLDLLLKEQHERERERNQLLSNIDDLKQRLTFSESERRSTQEKLTLLLTHQTTTSVSEEKKIRTSLLWQRIFKR